MAGIYIHIPFCKQKCTYCDFHFSTSFESYRKEMVQSICAELVLRKEFLANELINSIYFGGGTPSILNESELSSIFKTINDNFKISSIAEITLEANPDDISMESLHLWKKRGINRLSIGIQSFKQSDLRWMNRAHTAQESLNCIQLASSAGFKNLTVDLIYGLPNLTNDEWISHIQKVVNFGVTHISAYCLTVEENTVLNKLVNEKKIIPASEDQQSEQFLLLVNELQSLGFEQYEISNFCKPNHEAVHNSNYWTGQKYLGVGPSAHSYNGTERTWNIRNNPKYMKQVKVGEGYFESEILTPENRFNELLMTGLRTKFGVEIAQLEQLFPLDSGFWYVVKQCIENGVMIQTNSHLILTIQGRLQADRIASDLFQIAD